MCTYFKWEPAGQGSHGAAFALPISLDSANLRWTGTAVTATPQAVAKVQPPAHDDTTRRRSASPASLEGTDGPNQPVYCVYCAGGAVLAMPALHHGSPNELVRPRPGQMERPTSAATSLQQICALDPYPNAGDGPSGRISGYRISGYPAGNVTSESKHVKEGQAGVLSSWLLVRRSETSTLGIASHRNANPSPAEGSPLALRLSPT